MKIATHETITISNDNGVTLVVQFSGATYGSTTDISFHWIELQIGGIGIDVMAKCFDTHADKKIADEIKTNHAHLFT